MVEQSDLTHPTGATRLYPIIGDPIRYVESPTRFTRTLRTRRHDGVCIPMQVPEDDLASVMTGLTATANVDGILGHDAAQVRRFPLLHVQLDNGLAAEGRQHHPPQQRRHLAR